MIQMKAHNNAVDALGFWSAIVAAITSIAFSLAVLLPLLWAPGAPWDDILPLAPSLLLAPALLAMFACVHDLVPVEKQIWMRLAVAFAAVYVPLCTSAYVVQLFVVTPRVMRGAGDQVALLTVARLDSVLNAIDGLGYLFLSLASLCAAPAFDGRRLERWIRGLLLANGLLGLPIFLTYFVSRAFIVVAGLWGITIPCIAILLAVAFRRRYNESRLEADRHMEQPAPAVEDAVGKHVPGWGA